MFWDEADVCYLEGGGDSWAHVYVNIITLTSDIRTASCMPTAMQ